MEPNVIAMPVPAPMPEAAAATAQYPQAVPNLPVAPEPVAVTAAESGSVDKIRDILFGSQMRDYDKRFARLEERLLKESAELREETRRRFDSLESYIRVEFGSLSDRIGVLRDGRFEQIGTPDDIYHRPATEFVARFVGAPAMNILPATLTREAGALVARGDSFVAAVEDLPAAMPEDASVAVRAEDIQVSGEQSDATPHAAEIVHVERLGSHNILDIRLGTSGVKARTAPLHPVTAPGRAWLGFVVNAHLILDRRSGRFCTAKDQTHHSTRKEEQTCA